MRAPFITISKFVGTISLGLLTGVSYTLSTITFPSLLHLPTAPSASQAHSNLKSLAKRSQRLLSSLAILTFTSAFFLSPRRRQHPYLLWTALVCAIGTTPRIEGLVKQLGLHNNGNGGVSTNEEHEQLAESAVMVSGGSDSEEDRECVNGEVVRRGLERGKTVESVRASIWGLAFAMGVVGLWGDGA